MDSQPYVAHGDLRNHLVIDRDTGRPLPLRFDTENQARDFAEAMNRARNSRHNRETP